MENKIKPKYNDIDTKKEGSPIETPYKYTDSRKKESDKILLDKIVLNEVLIEELKND